MPFTKDDNRINRNGRPAGAKNKIPVDLKKCIVDYLDENIESTLLEISNLKTELKIKYFFELLQYVLAKQKENVFPDEVAVGTILDQETLKFLHKLSKQLEK